MAPRAIVTPLAFTKDGEYVSFFTQYFNSSRAEKALREQFKYNKNGDNSLDLINCSRVSYDKEHEGFSYNITVSRPNMEGSIRLYSVTFDTYEEAVEENKQFQYANTDQMFITYPPTIYIRGENRYHYDEEEEEETYDETEFDVDGLTLPFTEEMKETHSFYVGIPVFERMLFTDAFDNYEDALDFYKNGFQEHGVNGRVLQYHSGHLSVRFGHFSLWAFNRETEENYFLSADQTKLFHEDLFDVEVFTQVERDPDFIPTQVELEESEKEDEEALIEMEIEVEEEEEEELTEGEEDEFMFDLSGMRLKPYGKGYLLIPSKSDGDKQLIGTKYFLGGWWMSQRNAWFFKKEYLQDLMDLGAKKLHKSQKDRTGLSSKKVYWKKLERGYALVPKEDYKHYGKEEFRGGKWWKNGNAWFFTDNGRQRYIDQYGNSSSKKSH